MRHEDARSGGYFWSNHEADDELTRLKLIEQFNDPYTFRHLDAIGTQSLSSGTPDTATNTPEAGSYLVFSGVWAAMRRPPTSSWRECASEHSDDAAVVAGLIRWS